MIIIKLIFKYYTFELLPYGAVINVEGLTSSKKIYSVQNWNNSSSYTKVEEYLGQNRAYFIESRESPMEITYKYTNKNGKLESISTNLQLLNFEKGETGGKFTISNENWFNTPYLTETVTINSNHEGTISSANANKNIEECRNSYGTIVFYTRVGNKIKLPNNKYDGEQITILFEKEKPYVRLCCDEVKIENYFTNLEPSFFENGFETLNFTSSKIKVGYFDDDKYAYLARYLTISWSKKEKNNLYFGEQFNGYNRYAFYLLKQKEDNSAESERIKYIDNHKEYSENTIGFSYEIPAIKDANYKSCRIGYKVNLAGVGAWLPTSKSYIQPKFLTYTSKGFLHEISSGNGKYYVQTNENGMPSLISFPKWGGNRSFYTIINNSVTSYITPSNGLELHTDWASTLDVCTVNYNKNSEQATGDMESQTFGIGVGKQLLSNNFKHPSKTFIKWNTNSNGDGTSYDDEAFMTFGPNYRNRTVTLYAQWESGTPGYESWIGIFDINHQGYYVRVEGDPNANVVSFNVTPGQDVTVIGKNDSYYQADFGSGNIGWVAFGGITRKEEEEPEEPEPTIVGVINSHCILYDIGFNSELIEIGELYSGTQLINIGVIMGEYRDITTINGDSGFVNKNCITEY